MSAAQLEEDGVLKRCEVAMMQSCSEHSKPTHNRRRLDSTHSLIQHHCTTQEGWLSPTERVSVPAISLRHNLATGTWGESRRYVVAFTRCGWKHSATSRESKAHFGLPGYAPGTIAVNVTWMERGFNACKTPRCIYPSIFNHFWDIAIYRWQVTGFQQF